jgi:hypothetical protein
MTWKVRALLGLGWACFLIPLIAWPVTKATIWAEEPPGVMALSWLAIIATGLNILLTAEVKAKQ